MGTFAQAHIVPRAFYETSPEGPLHLFSGRAGEMPKRLPIGTYDDGIICRPCEAKYSYLDNYAAKTLKPWPRRSQLFRDQDGFIIKLDGLSAGYYLKNFDARRLILFFAFLLWRMAVTTRPEMHLKLGATLVGQLRTAVIERCDEKIKLWIYGTRFSDRRWKFVFSPRAKHEGEDVTINMEFFGFKFIINSRHNLELDEFALSRKPNWPILFEEFRTSDLYKFARSITEKQQDPWKGLRKSRNKKAVEA
jgi:hypothetical protein